MRNKTLLIGAMALTALAADAGLAERPGLLARWREAVGVGKCYRNSIQQADA